jgi:cyclic-di-GMP-binding protein
MPSFDIVSEVDLHEVRNAVDQANREIQTRYDFKGSDTRVEQDEQKLTLQADDDFKLEQARDILYGRLAKRKVDLQCLDAAEVEHASSGRVRQIVTVRQGIEADLARRIVKKIKDSKIKVQGRSRATRCALRARSATTSSR